MKLLHVRPIGSKNTNDAALTEMLWAADIASR